MVAGSQQENPTAAAEQNLLMVTDNVTSSQQENLTTLTGSQQENPTNPRIQRQV